MRIVSGFVMLAGFGLAGCFPTEGIVVRPGAEADPAPFCVAAVHGYLMGAPMASAAEVPDPKRIIGPGDVVTRDYNPSRTNIEVDAEGVISRVFCG